MQFYIFAAMIRMVLTDLDGTLLDSDQKVSRQDLETLEWLGSRKIARVIATGRSPFSFKRVIDGYFPVDYLVLSSGACIMDYHTREILLSHNLGEHKVHEIALWLRSIGQTFKVLAPVPDNHHYVYFQNGEVHSDFLRRMQHYRGYEKPISFDPPNFGSASQFLIILPPDPARFEELKSGCSDVKVIRATSPIDHQSIWMEIYHPDVSKGKAAEWLCQHLGISREETMGLGNDYNDTDLLDFVGQPFMVSNAPLELISRYRKVSSNNESGFTDAVRQAVTLSHPPSTLAIDD